MEITIIGKGVVGTATGEGFRRLGHIITYYDKGDEPKLGEVTFICTPEDIVEEVIKKLDESREWVDPPNEVLVVRSTVPPRTCDRFNHVSHNPEFLREGVADYEFMNPTRIIVGECCVTCGDILEELYRPFNVPIIRVDPTTSELIKLASNAYLATQISFWNQIALIAEKLNVNSHVVGKACALDPRISSYGASMHGSAYGGKCLPKDLAQLKLVALKLGVDPCMLDAVEEMNEYLKVRK